MCTNTQTHHSSLKQCVILADHKNRRSKDGGTHHPSQEKRVPEDCIVSYYHLARDVGRVLFFSFFSFFFLRGGGGGGGWCLCCEAQHVIIIMIRATILIISYHDYHPRERDRHRNHTPGAFVDNDNVDDDDSHQHLQIIITTIIKIDIMIIVIVTSAYMTKWPQEVSCLYMQQVLCFMGFMSRMLHIEKTPCIKRTSVQQAV